MDEIQMNGNDDPLQFDFGNDDPFAVPPPLGDLGPLVEDDPVNIGTEQNEDVNPQDNVAGDSPQESGGKEKKKRVVKPRVNLNEERLCSKKGVEALKNLCADVKFKGKGHEVSDLNKLLHRFEHWAQCLMPRWPFNSVVEKCEILGTKSKVKNELKRVRRNEDEILRGEPEDEDEDAAVGEMTTNEEEPLEAVPQEESPPSQLTEEQLERIRRNRELAFERLEANKRRKLEEESQTQSQLEEPTNAKLPTNEENCPEQSSFADITTENVEPDILENSRDEILQDLTKSTNQSHTLANYNETGFNSLSKIDGKIESQNNGSEINNSFQLTNLNIEKEQVGEINDMLDKNNDIYNETDPMMDQNPASQDASLPVDTSNGLDLSTSEDKGPHTHSQLKDATEDTAPILENDRPKSGTQSSNNAADGINNTTISTIATEHADLPKDGCITSSENLDGTSTGQMDLDDTSTE